MSQGKEFAGVLGFFDNAHLLIDATAKARGQWGEKIDAFTPYPVHGLEKAQGLKRSWLPYVTLCAGLTGTACAFLLQYWTSAVSWPINVGGKPYNSWPAFMPVIFELSVLFAGLATAAAMILVNGLPNMRRRSFDPALTRDRFALLIESTEEGKASEFLKSVGAKDVRSVYNEGWF